MERKTTKETHAKSEKNFLFLPLLKSSSTSLLVDVLVEKEEEGGRRRHRASYIIEFLYFLRSQKKRFSFI